MNTIRPRGDLTLKIDGVKNEIRDVLASGNYYCNDEIAREMTKINNGLDHLRLNENLDSQSKMRYHEKLPDPGVMLNKVSGYMNEYRNRMQGQNVVGSQENQIRELHQWAITNLTAIQKELQPYAVNAQDRISEFGDIIGVTDRFTGYRNNLQSRPDAFSPNWTLRCQTTTGYPSRERRASGLSSSIPIIGGTHYDDITFGSERPCTMQYRGYRTIDSLYPKRTVIQRRGDPAFSSTVNDVKTINCLNSRLEPVRRRTTYPDGLTPQELAGINMTFPENTEYKIRYTKPLVDIPTCDFVINPKPALTIFGRPLAPLEAYCRKSTEYQDRYDWPDGSRIVKLPWLRK